jgi:hypothetical protein
LERLLSSLFYLPVLRGPYLKAGKREKEELAGKWIVFAAADGRGFALAAPGPFIGRNGLAAAASRVRLAARIGAAAVDEDALRGMLLVDAWSPPDTWSRALFHHERTNVQVAYTGLYLSSSIQVKAPVPITQQYQITADVDRTALDGDGPWLVPEVRIACSELEANGVITKNEQGGLRMEMRINGEEASAPTTISVGIELGAISLSWQEVSALEPGATLEIECDGAIPCVLKGGGRGLVKAALTVTEGGFLMTVTDIIG